jgi:CheY-specific phosphatase CheX
MLAMSVDQLLPPAESCVGAGHLLGSVNLTGAWEGRIEVRMAEGLAYVATGAMLMQSADAIVEADALDAIKEIANMIAGTIKSSLPRPCAMTVPESAVEPERYCKDAAEGNSLIVMFRHEAGDLVVRVLEQGAAEV